MKRKWTLFICWVGVLLLGLNLHACSGAQPSATTDTSLIAFADSATTQATSDYSAAQIFTVQADGRNRKQLTSRGGNFLPAWSTDGQKLAFVSTRSGSPEVWIMDTDGTNAKQLTSSGNGNFLPAWSPDGTRIVFSSTRTGSPQIWIMNADGTNQTQLTTTGQNNIPTFSSSGLQIAFWSGDASGFGQVWGMDANGANKKQLTLPKVTPYTPNGSSANAPAWSG
jgi:TolB protein